MSVSALGDLASLVDAQLIGDPKLIVRGVAESSRAGAGEIAPLFDASQLQLAPASAAAAFLVAPRLAEAARELSQPLLLCAEPRRALGLLLEHFAPPPASEPGIHATAIVAATAEVHPSAYVGPFCLIEQDARVGAGCRLEAYCHVGAGAELGSGCRVGSHAVIGAACGVGADSVLGPGSVLGADGFGYWREDRGWRRIRSAGRVALGERTEVGANSCIDRATLGTTSVGAGSKLDNLVQVGHNVQLGERVLLCAQVGLAGSAALGADVVLGGQAGVADHRNIGAGARVGGGSGVASDVAAGQTVSGYPAIEHRRWLRSSVLFSKLDVLSRTLRQLARRVDALTAGQDGHDSGSDDSGGDDRGL